MTACIDEGPDGLLLKTPISIPNDARTCKCGRFFVLGFVVTPEMTILPAAYDQNETTMKCRWLIVLMLLGMAVNGSLPAVAETGSQLPESHVAPPRFPRKERYVKSDWRVWFRGREVKEASAQSFVDLGSGYGKDNWRVFFEGREMKDASALTFEVLAAGYARDNWHVFWNGAVVPKASSDSFAALDDGYARDNWHVFWYGQELEKASATSFATLGDGYARDNWHVYWCGRELPDADPRSFEVLGRGHARDAWRYWYLGRPVERP